MSTSTEAAPPVKSTQDTEEKIVEETTEGATSPTTLVKSSLTPADFQVKHPLQDAWTWWFDNPKKKTNFANWSDNLKKIYTFSSIEDFWSLWNNIKGAHELASGSNYHLFKEGIEPKWEDPQNARGGKWLVQIKPNQRATSLNQMWLWAVLACIGASFDDDSQVLGAVVSVRKSMDRIALWTADANDEIAVRRIGRQFKEILQLPPAIKLGYQPHADAMATDGSNTKYRYEV